MGQDFNAILGRRLRAARRQRGLSLHDVERLSEAEFKASVLGAYERGERALSVYRLVRLAGLYGVPAQQLLPADPVAIETADVIVDLESIGEQGDIVERFISAIHMMRGDGPGSSIRGPDLALLSSILEVVPESREP